jgi:hypothetical protein
MNRQIDNLSVVFMLSDSSKHRGGFFQAIEKHVIALHFGFQEIDERPNVAHSNAHKDLVALVSHLARQARVRN